MQTFLIGSKEMVLDLPNENPYSLVAWHDYCKRHGQLITARRIEQEAAKRPYSQIILMQRLGYVAIEVKESLFS